MVRCPLELNRLRHYVISPGSQWWVEFIFFCSLSVDGVSRLVVGIYSSAFWGIDTFGFS